MRDSDYGKKIDLLKVKVEGTAEGTHTFDLRLDQKTKQFAVKCGDTWVQNTDLDVLREEVVKLIRARSSLTWTRFIEYNYAPSTSPRWGRTDSFRDAPDADVIGFTLNFRVIEVSNAVPVHGERFLRQLVRVLEEKRGGSWSPIDDETSPEDVHSDGTPWSYGGRSKRIPFTEHRLAVLREVGRGIQRLHELFQTVCARDPEKAIAALDAAHPTRFLVLPAATASLPDAAKKR